MSAKATDRPTLTLSKMYERKSLKGIPYYVGRVGTCEWALVPTREIAPDGSPIWQLTARERLPQSEIDELRRAAAERGTAK